MKKERDFTVMIWVAAPLAETKTKLEAMGIKSVVIDPLFTIPQNSNYYKEMENNLKQVQQIHAE